MASSVQRELGHERRVRGARDGCSAERLVAKTFVVRFHPSQTAGEALACQNVIEHLGPASMQDRPPPVGWDGPVEDDQRAGGKRRVPRLLLGGDRKSDRRLVIFGVEVARDGDQTLGVAREKAIDQQPQLQGLGGSLERGEEVALRPPARRAPLRAAELFSGYRACTRCAQMQVDDIQPPAAGQLDLRKQQRSIEVDRLRLTFL